MKKFVTAFFMAWGNFLSLPCPCKLWDPELKNMMLAMLPFVGLTAGLVWFAAGAVLELIGIPVLLSALAMTFCIFAVCGFLHMDGFMDVNDAVMSRRPIEERRRILKDSTVGSFAVVTAIFLIAADFAAMDVFMGGIASADGKIRALAPLVLIPVASRSVSGACVLNFQPMETSQYYKDHDVPRGKFTGVLAVSAAVIAVIVTLICGSALCLLPALIACGGAIFAALFARKQLGGMNGDIAGYSICVGELAGMTALALMYGEWV
ncbi:MAG: adenosylcobinamide-GDP ribazoletransferase [Eubacterium sp.]|jgi:adenosylcobinamide-GDP ribazoletransferase